MMWWKPRVTGEIPPPRRAHTLTAVKNYLVVFGGGNEATYFNDLYVYNIGNV
jgi:hypothetical protein